MIQNKFTYMSTIGGSYITKATSFYANAFCGSPIYPTNMTFHHAHIS